MTCWSTQGVKTSWKTSLLIQLPIASSGLECWQRSQQTQRSSHFPTKVNLSLQWLQLLLFMSHFESHLQQDFSLKTAFWVWNESYQPLFLQSFQYQASVLAEIHLQTMYRYNGYMYSESEIICRYVHVFLISGDPGLCLCVYTYRDIASRTCVLMSFCFKQVIAFEVV